MHGSHTFSKRSHAASHIASKGLGAFLLAAISPLSFLESFLWGLSRRVAFDFKGLDISTTSL
jgi:hypothetical protein